MPTKENIHILERKLKANVMLSALILHGTISIKNMW